MPTHRRGSIVKIEGVSRDTIRKSRAFDRRRRSERAPDAGVSSLAGAVVART
jgi:hypothetical protein